MSKLLQQKQSFYDIIYADKPVLIKFFEDGCPGCRKMDAFLPFVEKRYAQLCIYEVNRNQFPELADKYVVIESPSLLVFREGKKIGHLQGGHAKNLHQTDDFLFGF